MLAVLKRRLVKLVVNFLFYFRTDEAEVGRPGGALERTGAGVPPEARPHPRLLLLFPQPVGALLLEHCRVTQEEPSGFSISECRAWRTRPAATPAPPCPACLCRDQVHCPGLPKVELGLPAGRAPHSSAPRCPPQIH